MIGAGVFSIACSKNTNKEAGNRYDWEKHQPFVSDYEVSFIPDNNLYVTDPVVLGELKLEESSGVSASVNNPGKLWTHQDSGNGNILYLIDAATAEILCTYRISGATNTDWEDMEVTTDPESGKAYIYISDTGDNDQKRATVTVYRLEEPVYTEADKGKTVSTPVTTLQRYSFRYNNGSRDVESMFVDKDTRDIYFVTKRDAHSQLYILPYPYQSDNINKAYHVGNFGFKEASAATANSRANKFIVRNRQYLFYWERKAGEKIWQTLQRIPERLPFTGEVQGEAVCFDAQDNYYTTSEKAGYPVYPPVYKYIKK